MKIRKLPILGFIFSLVFVFVSDVSAQSRSRSGKAKPRPSVSKSSKTLSPVQADFVQSVLDSTDRIDLKYATNTGEFANMRVKHGNWVSLPEPLNSQTQNLIKTYDDWIFIYGRVTNQGALSSLIELSEYEGKPDTLTPSVFARYNLSLQNPYQAINAIMRLANENKVRLRNSFSGYKIKDVLTPKDTSNERVILVPLPAPVNNDKERILDFETLVKISGKWRLNFTEFGQPRTFDFTFIAIDKDFFVGIPSATGMLYVPVIIRNGNMIISLHARNLNGQMTSTIFECNSIAPTLIKGKYTVKNNAREEGSSFTGTPLN